MSNYETKEYLAAGRSLEALLKWQEQADLARAAWHRFKESHGAVAVSVATWSFRGMRSVDGLVFPEGQPLPEGWKAAEQRAVPDRRRSAGRKISKEMDALPTDQLPEGVANEHYNGRHWYSPGVRQFGDKWVIIQHEKADPPADAIPLKKSEYWQMREDATSGLPEAVKAI